MHPTEKDEELMSSARTSERTDPRDGDRGPLLAIWRELATRDRLMSIVRSTDRALPVSSAANHRAWDEIDNATTAHIVAEAEQNLHLPWSHARASDYARFAVDGNRSDYETAVGARQRRLTCAVVAAAVARDPRFLRDAVDGLILMSEQSSWCWPAHDDSWERRTHVVPTVAAPYLDLGAGEVVAQLAWADQVLAADLDTHYPGVRPRLRLEADTRVFTPFLTRRDWFWLGIGAPINNWSPWIHSNLIAAALRLVDDEQRRAHVLELCIDGLDAFAATLPSDGAIDEGFAYWWAGAARLLDGLELLEHATDGLLSAHDVDIVRATVNFPHRMHLGGDWYVNFADAAGRPEAAQPWRLLFHWAGLVGDDQARRHAAQERHRAPHLAEPEFGLGRVLTTLVDPEWVNASASPHPLVSDVWLPTVEVAIARVEAGSPRGLAFAAKGGTNLENHNHNDVGSFIVATDGVPVLIDLGQPTYTATTFGPDRYTIWTMQGQWHNLPLPFGTQQTEGARYRASAVRHIAGDESSSFEADLVSAYQLPGLLRWRRSVILDRDHNAVSIDDEWACSPEGTGPQPSHRVHFIVAASSEPELKGDTLHVVPLDEATQVLVTWAGPVALADIERARVTDPRLQRVWGQFVWRLVLEAERSSSVAGSIQTTITQCAA